MKLRKNEKLPVNLSPEQKTQIELAKIELAKAKTRNPPSEFIYGSIIWGLVVVLALGIIAYSITKYNMHVNKLEHEKILNGYIKVSISGTNYLQWRKETYNKEE